VASFTRDFDSSFSGAGPHDLLVASNPQGTLGTHSRAGGFQLELTSGGNAVTTQSGKTTIEKLRIAHGALGSLGWGVLIPLGVICATAFKSFGSTWCDSRLLHVNAALLAGLILTLAQHALLPETHMPHHHS
jgi:hypothetical protein